MIINYDLWRERHNKCVEIVHRICELNSSKDSVKCNSALCVMKNAMQDIQGFLEGNVRSAAELCFFIRNIDVILTGILDINNILLGIGLNKTEKAIERCFTDKNIVCNFRTLRSLILAHPVDTHYINDRGESETIYEKQKMEYLLHSDERSYTEENIGNDTSSNALWGIRCFRLLMPYINELESILKFV